MIQNVLREIGGIGLYGMVSVCLFFFAFGIVLVRAFSLRKPDLDAMGALPLQEDETVDKSRMDNCHE